MTPKPALARTAEPALTRVCHKCKRTLPADSEYFGTNKQTGRLLNWCRRCYTYGNQPRKLRATKVDCRGCKFLAECRRNLWRVRIKPDGIYIVPLRCFVDHPKYDAKLWELKDAALNR